MPGASKKPLGALPPASDTVDAGTGDRVLALDEGNGARQVLASKDALVCSVIVGIVDAVTAS
jgi:microcompartment protein CcmK/EutM